MVAAIDAAGARAVDGGTERRVEPRLVRDANLVRDRVLWFVEAVRQVGRHRGRDVLHQRAAGGDVQDLRATAYRQDGEVVVHGAPGEDDFKFVTTGLGILDALVSRLSVKRRIHIAAAGQQHAGDGLQES